MRIGIGTWTFGWSFGLPGFPKPIPTMTLFDLLDKAKELNVSLVQMGENTPLDTYDKELLEEISAKASKMGIDIEVITESTDPRKLERFLEIAKIMRSKIVRTYTLNEEVERGLTSIIDNIRSVIKEYEKENVTILLENHEEIPALQLKEIVEGVGSNNIGILLDTGNSLGVEEPLYYVVEVLLPYIEEVHMKEYAIKRMEHKLGFEIFGVPLGEGRINVDRLIKTLIDAGKKHVHLVIEQWTPFQKTINATVRLEHIWAVRNVEFLRNKLIEYGVYEP
jgi:sugar phosphate isomerase/epimerase